VRRINLDRRGFLGGMLAGALAAPVAGQAQRTGGDKPIASEQHGPATGQSPRMRIGLDGAWQFRLDSEAGFNRTIWVPGCWQAQGVGKRSGILRHDYEGVAWYQRAVPIPYSWKGKRTVLRVGGALRNTDLFVNGKPAGRHEGMSAPFAFDISEAVRPGGSNSITLKISNAGGQPVASPDKQRPTRPTGMLNYIGDWGGIYGPVELETTGRVWIEQLWVRSDIHAATAQFGIQVRNAKGRTFRGRLRIVAVSYHGVAAVQVPPGQAAEVHVDVPMPGASLWSPDHPNLYTAGISLMEGAAERDRVEQRFGLREIRTQGNVLLLNGKPLYLRGYGDDNVEVLTGVPPASKQVYLERLRLAKSFGFNAMRFHSMTPVREFFEAADEVGMLVMAELPVAYTQYLLPFLDFVRGELTGVALAHRNHPSWLSLAMGNEFNLHWVKDESEKGAFLQSVAGLYQQAKSLMPDRIIMSNDGYLMEPTDMVSEGRGASPNHPTVRHEFGGYYCSLPDTSLIPRFTGVMIPAWLESKQRWVIENGLASEYPAYVGNSQKLVQLGRRFQIERVRQEADVTGYEYWLIVDYPGGTGEGDSWEEGWFDYFWRSKDVTPEGGREINDAVLPLVDAGPGERTLWVNETKYLKLLVSNYGEREIRDGSASWRVSTGGKTVAGSRIGSFSAPLGKISPASTIALGRWGGNQARKFELTVDVDGHTNRWDFWAFPRQGLMSRSNAPIVATASWPGLKRYFPFIHTDQSSSTANDLRITDSLDYTAIDFLQSGGRVWLALDKPAKVSFFPAAGGALGTIVRDHPALQGFPHEGFCDLQFHNLMQGTAPFPLDAFPKVDPVIGGIRTKTGFLSKVKELSRVGYVFEAKVGAGRLLVTTLRIGPQLDDAHPEAVFLCDRLLRYCDSGEFQPQAEIPRDRVSREVSEYVR
jgi:beta-galactosidase